ncbi:response regulator [Sphingomonas sp. ID0503]|uniref:response regulator n=1 Tax=Sphingomonas sp. ID0503 TaxID=3399691 RepID=UPI003AFA69C2
MTMILLVEDEVMLASVMQASLEDGGFSVAWLGDGESAIRALEDSIDSISALLTDIRLPDEITGWDIARRARALRPDLPVIYMSGDSASAWTAHGVPRSIMLQKPFASAQLVTAIASLLNEAAAY